MQWLGICIVLTGPSITNNPSYDENVSEIHRVVVESLDEYIPETTRLINYKKLRREPWLTAGIQTSTRKAKLLYKQTQKKNCDNHCLDRYKKYNQEEMLNDVTI